MSWWAWLLIGVGAGVAVSAKVQREAWIYFGIAKPWSTRVVRGGGIELDTPGARSALRLPIVTDPSVPVGHVKLRTSSLQRCNPERGVHYHGEGDRCECGAQPNSWVVERWTVS